MNKIDGDRTMMKMKAAAKAISFVVMFSVLLSIVYAQDLRNDKIIPAIMHILAPPSEMESRKLSTQLKLTPEQNKEMGKLYADYVRSTRSFKQRYEVKFKQLLILMRDPAPNGRQVEAECSEFLNLERQVLRAEIEYWTGLKNVLTKRQMNKLWNYMESKRVK